MSSPGSSRGHDLWGGETKTVLCRIPFLANNGELSDVKFIFQTEEGEKIIHGHKLILALASPVFHQVFYSKSPGFRTNGNADKIKMEGQVLGLGPQAFENFIKFLYMGRFESKEFEGLSVEIIIRILRCADHYDVPYLKKKCVCRLWNILTKENVIPILEAALLFGVERLAIRAYKIIDRNTRFVFASQEILSIKAGTLCEILKRNTLDIENEVSVLDLSLKWAKNKCNLENLVPRNAFNMRKVLGPAFFEIRFALLPSTTISNIVREGLLTKEETVEMFVQYRESTMVMAHDNRIAPDVLFKSNVRIRGLEMATNGGQLAAATNGGQLAAATNGGQLAVATKRALERIKQAAKKRK